MQRLRSAIAAPVLFAFSLRPAAAQAQTPTSASEDVPPATAAEPRNPPPLQGKPPLSKPPPPKPPPRTPPQPPPGESGVRSVLIGAGLVGGILLLGTGVIYTISSAKRASEADRLEKSLKHSNGPDPCRVPGDFAAGCNNLTKLQGSRDRFANIAIGTFVAGGAIGIGTLIYALVTMKQPESTAIQIRPVVGTGSAGLTVRGHW